MGWSPQVLGDVKLEQVVNTFSSTGYDAWKIQDAARKWGLALSSHWDRTLRETAKANNITGDAARPPIYGCLPTHAAVAANNVEACRHTDSEHWCKYYKCEWRRLN